MIEPIRPAHIAGTERAAQYKSMLQSPRAKAGWIRSLDSAAAFIQMSCDNHTLLSVLAFLPILFYLKLKTGSHAQLKACILRVPALLDKQAQAEHSQFFANACMYVHAELAAVYGKLTS